MTTPDNLEKLVALLRADSKRALQEIEAYRESKGFDTKVDSFGK